MSESHAARVPPETPWLTEKQRDRLIDRLRRLIGTVTRRDQDDGYILVWTEIDSETNEVEGMVWHPETEDELTEAGAFYDACYSIGRFALPILPGEPLRRSSDEMGLIRSIIANRDERTLYLIYADYLTENGSTQGSFIRQRIRYCQTPEDDPLRWELDRQITELVEAHAEEWIRPLTEIGLRPEESGIESPYVWLGEEGVIDRVIIDRPGILPDASERLFAAAPLLRRLAFVRGHLKPDTLGGTAQLTQIEELDLTFIGLDPPGLTATLASPSLTALRRLNLRGNELGEKGGQCLGGSPLLGRLRALNVADCELGHRGVVSIARSREASGLRELHLGGNHIEGDPVGGATVMSVCSSPNLANIRILGLDHTLLDSEGVRGLGQASFEPVLEQLSLRKVSLSSSSFSEFSTLGFPNLRMLNLDSVSLGADGGRALANAKFRATLTKLDLDASELEDGGLAALAGGSFHDLVELILASNLIGSNGLAALARSRAFPALRRLDLRRNQICSHGVEALLESELAPRLRVLDLSGNPIGLAGAQAIARSKALTDRLHLFVDGDAVGEAGKRALLERFVEGKVEFH